MRRRRRYTEPERPQGRIAIGYCRCSTEEQSRASAFNTLQAQEQMIRAYCAREHPEWELQIVHEVRSAKDTNRPVLQQILQRVKAGEVCAVIVYKLDRFARSVRDLLLMDLLLQEHGTELISLKEQIDTTTAIGRLYRTLMAAFAEFEREVIAERTRDKMRAMTAQGLWVKGRPPMGYRVDRKRKRLAVDPEAAQWVQRIFERFAAVGSVGRVAHELNADAAFLRFLRRTGRKPARTDKLLEHILSNPVYTGNLYWGDECLATGAHPALVSQEQWEYVQALLPRRRRYKAAYAPATREDPYLLRGAIYCHECGGALSPYWVQGNRLVHYYAHPRKSLCSLQRVNLNRVHEAVWRALREVLQLDGFMLQTLLEAERAESAAARRELQQLGQEIERLLQLYREGIEVPELGKQLHALQARRAELAASTRVVDGDAVQQQVQALQRLLSQWDRAWEHLSIEERRELFTLVVSRVEVLADWARVYIPLPKVRVKEPYGDPRGIRTPVLQDENLAS